MTAAIENEKVRLGVQAGCVLEKIFQIYSKGLNLQRKAKNV